MIISLFFFNSDEMGRGESNAPLAVPPPPPETNGVMMTAVVEQPAESEQTVSSLESSSSVSMTPKRPVLGVKWDPFSSDKITVSGLRHGGLAERCGFEVGMELLAIEGHPITDIKSLDQGLQRVQEIGRGSFTVRKKQKQSSISRFIHITDTLNSREYLPQKPDITLYVGGGERVPVTQRATTNNITAALKWLTRHERNISRNGEDNSWLLIIEDSKRRVGHTVGSLLESGILPPPGAVLTVLTNTDSVMDIAEPSFRYVFESNHCGGVIYNQIPEPAEGFQSIDDYGSCVVVTSPTLSLVETLLPMIWSSIKQHTSLCRLLNEMFKLSISNSKIHSFSFMDPSEPFSLTCQLTERMNGLRYWERMLSEKTKRVEELEEKNKSQNAIGMAFTV